MDKNPNTTFIDYLNSMGDGKRERDKKAPVMQPPPDNHQIEKVHKVQNDISALGKVFKL